MNRSICAVRPKQGDSSPGSSSSKGHQGMWEVAGLFRRNYHRELKPEGVRKQNRRPCVAVAVLRPAPRRVCETELAELPGEFAGEPTRWVGATRREILLMHES